MLDTLVDLATVVGAVPVTVAAVVFLGKTLPAYFTTPDGLRLEVTRVVGDFGYFVRVTNYSPVERHIEYVGVMPAGLRPLWPLWVRAIRRISAKRNSVESLRGYTIGVAEKRTLSSGESMLFRVPQPLDSETIASEQLIQEYSALVDRDASRRRDPGRPASVAPYVRLSTGTVVLGKKVTFERELQCLAMMSCRCGHSPTQHENRERRRLAAKMFFLAHCHECECRRYKEVGERMSVDQKARRFCALSSRLCHVVLR